MRSCSNSLGNKDTASNLETGHAQIHWLKKACSLLATLFWYTLPYFRTHPCLQQAHIPIRYGSECFKRWLFATWPPLLFSSLPFSFAFLLFLSRLTVERNLQWFQRSIEMQERIYIYNQSYIHVCIYIYIHIHIYICRYILYLHLQLHVYILYLSLFTIAMHLYLIHI